MLASSCAVSSGSSIAGFIGAAIVVTIFSPVLVHLLTLGVHGSEASAAARKECWILLFLVLPQILFYGIVAIATAAQNARGKFVLAAAAPAVENIGTIVTLLLVRQIFGTDTSNVSTAYLLFLGTGATLAVGVHAVLQCFGAARVGLPLWPRWGWHDDAIRALGKAPRAGDRYRDPRRELAVHHHRRGGRRAGRRRRTPDRHRTSTTCPSH